MRLVLRRNLMLPAKQGSPETARLFGEIGILKIVAESSHELEWEIRIIVVLKIANEFLCSPGGEHFALRVTGIAAPSVSLDHSRSAVRWP